MPSGGYRKNAGRPKGIGPFGEATKPMRVPLSRIDEVKAFLKNGLANNVVELPIFSHAVAAGTLTAADDNVEAVTTLDDLLLRSPEQTFMVRAQGDSMINAGIHSGDLMLVDKSITPAHGKVVVVAVDGELTVKRLHKQPGSLSLLPENPDFQPIPLTENNDIQILGVVTNTIHSIH